MSLLDEAHDHLDELQRHFHELDSFLEETLQVADTLDVKELGKWKLLFKEAREFFKEQKGHLGGFQKKLDRALVNMMVDLGLTEMDVEGVRLYADMRGFFGVRKGFEDEAPMTREPDKTEVIAQCDAALKGGLPLPRWASEHIEPEVRTRRLKR